MWVNKENKISKVWFDATVKSTKQAWELNWLLKIN